MSRRDVWYECRCDCKCRFGFLFFESIFVAMSLRDGLIVSPIVCTDVDMSARLGAGGIMSVFVSARFRARLVLIVHGSVAICCCLVRSVIVGAKLRACNGLGELANVNCGVRVEVSVSAFESMAVSFSANVSAGVSLGGKAIDWYRPLD